MTINQVLAYLLIALTPIHWWALAIVVRGVFRHPEVHALRPQLWRLAFSGAGAMFLAIVAANFLLGGPLPSGAGFVLLVLTLLSISGPPVVFLVDFYRPSQRKKE